jgi:DNA-directed RNA polymerase subunit RPC12/RpoP
MIIMIKKVEYECLVCGDHIKSDSSKRIMCYECGNGIYAPVTTLMVNQ